MTALVSPERTTQSAVLRVALLGNPNTGKTTLFNVLTGFRAKTGNYAGVTVERRVGRVRSGANAKAVELVDLPGAYSLSAQSPDERLTVDILLGLRDGEKPVDAVLVVLDATNLRRNLLMATQVMELGLPTVFALNMSDAAEKQGLAIKPQLLAERLGAPVVTTVASKGSGAEELGAALEGVASQHAPTPVDWRPEALSKVLGELAETVASCGAKSAALTTRFFLERALFDRGGACENLLAEACPEAAKALPDHRKHLHDAGYPLPTLESRARYAAIDKLLEGVAVREKALGSTMTDRLDAVLVHPVWGFAIFCALMLVVFQAIYAWSGPFMDMIDWVFGFFGQAVAATLPEGALQSLVSDGVIAGVGGVVIFLPQILILFFFLGLLEDSGYMARAAFVMDRVLGRLGLSGRSFIPLLSSFACAIPGVMATRTIADPRERLKTMMLAPLMSCSARLPVYVLFIGAFVPDRNVLGGVVGLQGVVLFAMYSLGAVTAVVIALCLQMRGGRGRRASVIMEMPPYRRPQWRTVGLRLYDRGMAFLKTAGTIILAVSILVWACAYFPRPASIAEEVEAERLVAAEQLRTTLDGEELAVALEELDAEFEGHLAGTYLRQSILGRTGQVLEPVVRPLGWDWRIAMSVVASFPAREVIVATLGVIFDVGEADEESVELMDKLEAATWPDGRPLFTLPVALSIMVFFAYCAQCAATLATIKRETNSWKWPLLSFGYMTALAYVAALVTFHVSTWLLG